MACRFIRWIEPGEDLREEGNRPLFVRARREDPPSRETVSLVLCVNRGSIRSKRKR